MPDQNQPNDLNQNPTPGNVPSDPLIPARPNLTTEEVPPTPPAQDPNQPISPVVPVISPPQIPDTSDIPLPPLGPELTDTTIPSGGPIINTSPSFDLPPVVGAPPKKKFGGKKVISTILGLLLLIGGLGVGVTLVKQQQNIGEKAAAPTDQGSCTGCSPAGYNWVWKNGQCKASETKCGSGGGGGGGGATYTCESPNGFQCVTGISQCPEIGQANRTGSCFKGICCSKPTSGGGGGGGGAGGIGEKCLKGGVGPDTRDATFEGKCKVALCPNGDTDKDGTCSVNKDTGFRYGGTVDCSQGDAALGGMCGQVDPIGTDGVYCKTASNNGGSMVNDCTAKTGGGGGGGGGTCKEECPGSDGVLRSCTPPEEDGTSDDSVCNAVGRVESCGGKNYCCPTVGGKWTADMSACQGTAQCQNVKAYKGDDTFTPLTADDLKALKVGDRVRFAVAGTATGTTGSFDKAKFKINTTDSGEVTTKKPSSQEFYYEFTVPAGTTSFNVTANIHHSVLGWSK